MGFWSSVGSFISSVGSAISSGLSAVGSAICRGVSALCTAIAGTSLGSAIGGVVSKLVTTIGVAFPPLEIINAIIIVASIVAKIAEAIGIKEKDKDEPDELAMKAEKSDKKPEDFDSTEAYIKYLQKEIELTDEDKEKLENMDDEKRSAYRATGTYLYTKCINEKLGFDTTGLKNPELIGITADILTDLAKLNKILSPSDFVVYSKHLQSAGLSLDDFSNYLHNTCKDAKIDKKVQNAIAGAMFEIDPSVSESDIERKLTELNIEV